jgi:dinuclear metal center YbgI/SA1388 family protein
MELATIRDRLDDTLRTDAYADLDASANGLQVGPDTAAIEHVAFAVDAAEATIQSAAEADADLLVTHHGLSWGGIEHVTGREYRLIEALVDAEMALYVSHLPLDGHQELGNAAQLAETMELTDREPFGELGTEHIGQRGTATDPFTAHELRGLLDGTLDNGGQSVQVLEFGPETIEEVAIVTGSGTDWLDEAIDLGADALVTGEGKQKAHHQAREAGIHVFLAGHYATETGGVQALQSRCEQWGPSTTWIDHPTGI